MCRQVYEVLICMYCTNCAHLWTNCLPMLNTVSHSDFNFLSESSKLQTQKYKHFSGTVLNCLQCVSLLCGEGWIHCYTGIQNACDSYVQEEKISLSKASTTYNYSTMFLIFTLKWGWGQGRKAGNWQKGGQNRRKGAREFIEAQYY